MFILRYDILLAIRADYPGDPLEVIKNLGYRDTSFISQQGNSIFLEVDQINEPLPLFLERSDIIDGRIGLMVESK